MLRRQARPPIDTVVPIAVPALRIICDQAAAE
jgi:hypothetical protein